MRWLSRLVSGLIIAAVLVAAAMLIRSRLPRAQVGQHFQTWALFRDASRLSPRSPVMIAGVRVGEVSRLSLAGELARVDLRLRDDIDIPADSWVTKRAQSAFGDSYIEIVPTTGAEEGAPGARRLRSGEQLTHVVEGSSTDSVLRTIDRSIPTVERALDTLHDVAIRGRRWSSGGLQDAIEGAQHWLAMGHIAGPLETASSAMARVEGATGRAARALAGARPQVLDKLVSLDLAITKARTKMADLRTGLHDSLANARDGLDEIDPKVQQMADLIAAVDEGRGEDWKGSLGRLVDDPHMGDELTNITGDLESASHTLDWFKSYLGLRLENNLFSLQPRIYVTAELHARTDKLYLIEFEKGPLGGVPSDQLTDSPGVPQYTRYQEIPDKIRFTAQFGKVIAGRYIVRGGIKDSTFGLGGDVLLGEGRLKLTADLFGSFQTVPRLKLAAALQVFRSVYVLGGVDDALNAPGYLSITKGNTDVPTQFDQVRYGRDYFLGASVHFTDEDLAVLIRVYGAMLVGLL